MIKKIHIMFVNSTSEIGGADVDLLEICRHLDQNRFRFTVILPHPGPLSDDFLATGAQVIYLDPSPIKRFTKPIQWGIFPFRIVLATFNLWRLIRREKPVIVHVNTSVLPSVAFAARLARVRCVWHMREIELLQRSRIIGSILRACIWLCSDRIVAISQAVAEVMGVAAQPRVRVIYHGVDTVRFRPREINQTLRHELHIPGSAYVIGFIGRLAPIKGLEYLIQAFHQILQADPNAYLLLVGADSGYKEYVADLRRQTAKLGLTDHVIFLPNHKDIPEVIHAMDLLVLPTIIPEGLGLVLLEALASGKPVIATNQGGPVEILGGCTAGRLVPPKDATALVQAVLELSKLSTEQQRLLSQDARAWVLERFSIERMIDNLSCVYESLIPPTSTTTRPF